MLTEAVAELTRLNLRAYSNKYAATASWEGEYHIMKPL